MTQVGLVDHQALARDFHDQGFVVIRNSLSAEQLSIFNRAVDHDLSRHGGEWVRFDESLIETPDVLSRTSEFDSAIENPTTLGVLRSLIGELIAVTGGEHHR